MKQSGVHSKIFFLIYFIFILQFSQCSEEEKIQEDSAKVNDLPWDGNSTSIPAAMKESNPIASGNALKGGTFRYYAHQYPKSLNYYLDQMSTTAQIFTMMFEPLTTYHPKTLKTMPHIARDWQISPDKRKFRFFLDPNAKWSDGRQITADDVMFTYKTIMDKNNNTAVFRIGLSRFEEPKIIDPHTIEFTAKTIHWNNFNEVASGFYILPKHAFEGKDFNKMNFEFPVTSGPYKLFDSKKGRFVKMQRRGDYWQRAYPFNKGRYNFDMLLFKFFNDGSIAFQALKKGDVDIYGVNIAFIWIKEATGEKFDRNLIAKQKVFNDRPIGFQGWAMNTRKDIFKDRRVRKAISHLVNRKLMIEKLAYGQYEPTNSYYPDYYFGKEKNPNEPVDFNVGKARALLAEAGWKANSKGILEKEGKEFSFKILDRDGSTEKYFTVFLEVAKQVGIKAGIDRTDLAGWSARVDKYDFDMTWAAWGGAMFKDPEAQWSSKFADEEGQPNLSGLKIPEVDRLIEAQKGEFDVAKRNQIVKKIDTIVYKEYPYVLLWHLNCSRLLYWQKFGMPSYPLGKYGDETAALDYWWIDEKKTTELENADKNNGSLSAIEKEIRWKE